MANVLNLYISLKHLKYVLIKGIAELSESDIDFVLTCKLCTYLTHVITTISFELQVAIFSCFYHKYQAM